MTTIVRRNEAPSVPSDPGLSAENVWHLADRTTALRRGITSLLGETAPRNERATVTTTDADELADSYSFLREPQGKTPAFPYVIAQAFKSRAKELEELENVLLRFEAWPRFVHGAEGSGKSALATAISERAGFVRLGWEGVVHQLIRTPADTTAPQDLVDWDFRIESPPVRPAKEVRMRFVQTARQAPRIRENPEE